MNSFNKIRFPIIKNATAAKREAPPRTSNTRHKNQPHVSQETGATSMLRAVYTWYSPANTELQALASQYPVMMDRFVGVLVVVRHRVSMLSGSVLNNIEESLAPKMTLPMNEKNTM